MDPIEQSSTGMPERIGRYRIVEKLGEDALGAVYAASDENDRARVRLRVLPEAVHRDAARRARLIEDARAAMLVEHPDLSAVLDVLDTPQALHVVSEAAAPRTLRAYVEERGRLDLAEALRLAGELASAIGAVHRHGLVHGLLGDERVAIAEDGRSEVVDLGLAELVRPSAMRPPDARTDVYAIGALLHQMISGVRASTSDLSSEPLERLPPLEAIAPETPPKLLALIERATSPDPERRPADADRLLAALTEIDLPSEPIARQAAETRDDVRESTATMWIVGASVALGLVITVVLVLMVSSG